MKLIQYFSGITLLLLLTACTKAPAPDYQGTWKNTFEDPKLENALVIAKNGEIRKSSMSNVNTNEKYRFWAFFLKDYVL